MNDIYNNKILVNSQVKFVIYFVAKNLAILKTAMER